ncbi:hypothetical protein HUU62_17955 [Rhodoferax sp. 4810]|nr:hypothetical protein [Rhodoferax jenense]
MNLIQNAALFLIQVMAKRNETAINVHNGTAVTVHYVASTTVADGNTLPAAVLAFGIVASRRRAAAPRAFLPQLSLVEASLPLAQIVVQVQRVTLE